MLPPLGLTPELWEKRHQVHKKAYGKDKYWKKGYEAGKDSTGKHENPYFKKMDLDLARKGLLWLLGWEEGAYSKEFRDKRLKKARKETKREKERQEKKEAKWKEKHKHDKHKKKHRRSSRRGH